MSVRIGLKLDEEVIQWVEQEWTLRGLETALGAEMPSAEDRLILQIHAAISQPVFDKVLAARGNLVTLP
jgi:hypothetical protein